MHRGGAPQLPPQTRSGDPEAVVFEIVHGSKENKGGWEVRVDSDPGPGMLRDGEGSGE